MSKIKSTRTFSIFYSILAFLGSYWLFHSWILSSFIAIMSFISIAIFALTSEDNEEENWNKVLQK